MRERKIRGEIVCHRRDQYGEMIVADDGRTRSLYFGDGILQSSIRTDQPGFLIEDYHRAIMTSLLFTHNPRSILLIGLGGCSLVHFLLNNFPDCTLDVVEIREQVIGLAYDYFLLPKENARLKIFTAAAQEFITQTGENYDLIIVDAFDDGGPAGAVTETRFLAACRRRLKQDGICAFNLWHRPKDNFPALYAAIQESFEDNTLKLFPAEVLWNVIVFGFTRPVGSRELSSCRRKARMFQESYGINFPRSLRCLCWQNFA